MPKQTAMQQLEALVNQRRALRAPDPDDIPRVTPPSSTLDVVVMVTIGVLLLAAVGCFIAWACSAAETPETHLDLFKRLYVDGHGRPVRGGFRLLSEHAQELERLAAELALKEAWLMWCDFLPGLL